MKPNLAAGSLLLLLISIVLLVMMTAIEPALVGTSTGTQRLLALLFLVLPAGAGSALGVASLVRREGRAWLAVTGAAMNGVFALFHLMIVLFAG